MIRSLFSGVSGMKNHQIRMDTLANNIANVNTTGFKAARCNFQDLISQNLRSPSAGDGTVGGVNPSQVGLGVSVSSIANNMQQGATQTTGRTLDCAIQGNGYFIVDRNGSEYYTREGIFYVDNLGSLVNSNGDYLCDDTGAALAPLSATPELIQTITISQTGLISTTVAGVTTTEQLGLATFPNDVGLKKIGQNLYSETPASGVATPDIAGTSASGVAESRINSGFLEMSNVDLTDEFATMIITQRGYQANARTVTVSDTMLEELINLKR